MSTYRAAALTGMRAAALIGILPGAIVAAAYLLVLASELYHHWSARTALVLAMAAWGVLGVVELWRAYVWLSGSRVGVKRVPLSPRAVLCVWALLLAAVAAWRADEHPWVAAFLGLVALYSFGRAFGLVRYVARRPEISGRASAARSTPSARARGGGRSRARTSYALLSRTSRAT